MAKNKVPDFEVFRDTLLKELSPHVAEMAKGHFKGSFIKEGFTDYGFMAWPKRKDNETHKILTKSQTLRDSIEIVEASSKRVVISAGKGIPYTAIHNTGGIIKVTVTEKARRFFWYMFKQTGNDNWKWMALTKKESFQIRIPQRQYIGPSATLEKNVGKYIAEKFLESSKEMFKNMK